MNTSAAGNAAVLRSALAFAVEASRLAAVPTPPTAAGAAGVPEVAPVAASTSIDSAISLAVLPCGGEYPPCYVALRESGNDYNAYNPTGCDGNGCFGRWQFSGAWAGKLGLPTDLATATPEQQDAAARELWANGAGASHWGAG